jgi:hypothetical protein
MEIDISPREAIAHRPDPDATVADKLAWALNFAVLAPSKHNTQPWYFEVAGDAVDVHADGARALTVSDPYGREMLMGCGAALANLRLGIRSLGYDAEVHTFPHGASFSHLARVRLGDPSVVTDDEQRLISAVPRRHTQRLPLDGRDLSSALLADLIQIASTENATLHFLASPDDEHVVAELVGRAHGAVRAGDPAQDELLRWSRDPHDPALDGVPFLNRGLGAARSFTRYPMRDFDQDRTAERPETPGIDSPLAALLCTTRDEPASWLAAGQALEMVLLRACVDGVQASFLNQPIESPLLRREMSERLGIRGYPQMVLRLGWGVGAVATPRRPVATVTLDSTAR